MIKFKSLSFFKHLVLIFLIAYLFVSFTNMFFIARYTSFNLKTFSNQTITSNGPVKYSNINGINLLKFFDKSSFDDDPFNTPRFVPKCLLLIFIFSGFSLALLKIRSTVYSPQIFHNRQGSYLSFCIFRI